jgi:hypothetical protein
MPNRLSLVSILLPLGIGLSFFILLGCQTLPLNHFNEVRIGQDKSDVIEILGGPNWSERRNGVDRWNYIFYQDGARLEKQIHFQDGLVTYKGPPMRSFFSAEERDKFNEEKERALSHRAPFRVPPTKSKKIPVRAPILNPE